ncbi:hypothetical protein Plav_2569 [Parvibaculum lavamentivorans DS-1]|uniref:Flagellar biosynthesis protein FliO n=1 Tax=Parvibaculum lavamentivorans (strain DS-1 / DSM 13023 / NCIMB 13966) TaxID=402881 RepID=A7HW95_PARL1|nr:flagellar biosynthetic protein FliO [Parvibaculum lavamentivorans]ABS64178.1 hypothetical protein Plav_2569 [Parvibaculum lavamentivorans DS-1]
MDFSEIFRFVAALAFIIGLIGLCAVLAKRFGLVPGGVTAPGSQRRLGIVEVKQIDPKHRLVLIRRDGKEHLLLTGGDHPLLVETGIEAPVPAEVAPAEAAPVLPFERPAAQFQRIVDFIRERRA